MLEALRSRESLWNTNITDYKNRDKKKREYDELLELLREDIPGVNLAALKGKQIDGIWHTGIVVYGKEFYFGSGGIDHCPPCGTILGDPDEILDLGTTEIPESLFHQYLIGLDQDKFRPEKYNLFEHNCNTFSNEAAQFLTGRTIPKRIKDLPKDLLNTPFGAMIKPIFDSMSIRPQHADGMSLTATGMGLNSGPDFIFEPRPTTSDVDSLISEGPKIKLKQSKDVPVIYNNYEIASLVSSLKQTIEKEKLNEKQVQELNEIEEVLKTRGNVEVEKNHLQLLENLLEKYEYSGEDAILTSIIQTLGLMVLKKNVILMVCQDPVSKPVFKLAREFSHLSSPDVQCAVVELFTNICSTDVGRGMFVAEDELPVGDTTSNSSVTKNSDVQSESLTAVKSEDNTGGALGDDEGSSIVRKGSIVEHQQAIVDHRDVVQVTVQGLLGDDKTLCEKAAALVYNISMAKVSEESAMECASAILEYLRKNDTGNDAILHCLFAFKNFVKISPEVVNLASVIGIDLSKFVKLSKKIEEICNELEQYLIV